MLYTFQNHIKFKLEWNFCFRLEKYCRFIVLVFAINGNYKQSLYGWIDNNGIFPIIDMCNQYSAYWKILLQTVKDKDVSLKIHNNEWVIEVIIANKKPIN